MQGSNSTHPYNEVEGIQRLLGYRTYSAAMCRVLSHPQWGTAVYPASIFTNAPVELVAQIMELLRLSRSDKTDVPC
jgi:hypothetical protein